MDYGKHGDLQKVIRVLSKKVLKSNVAFLQMTKPSPDSIKFIYVNSIVSTWDFVRFKGDLHFMRGPSQKELIRVFNELNE